MPPNAYSRTSNNTIENYKSWKVFKVLPVGRLSVEITLILAAVILHEQFTVKSIIGCLFITFGTMLMVL